MRGTFYGIGVGPGDPELLTIKAANVLKKVDVIIAPKTEKKEGSVAFNIAKPYLRDDVEIVYQVFPMVRGFADNSGDAWEKNKDEIIALLDAGKNVAFLTLGDAMFYSTYIYVFRLLEKAGIPIETIPGIPAFVAIGSHLNWPIVEGDDVLSIIPATAGPERVREAIRTADNVVIMKVYKNFPDIADTLQECGMIDKAVMVSRCGLPDEERIDDIAARSRQPVNYLSTVLARKR